MIRTSCQPACVVCAQLREVALRIIGKDGLWAVTLERLGDETRLSPAEVQAHYATAASCVGDTYEETALSVYEDFVRTKKKCGEPTDGLSFDKFSHTLKKNRDALVQRHACKRVKFSVYVKEGRASLKATPVRE